MMKTTFWLRLGALAILATAVPACDDGSFHNEFFNVAWFIDPVFGDDTMGDGSPQFPLKSMTRALQFAISGDEIILANGSYSTTNGEVFPILVKPGIAIIGNTTTPASVTVSGAGAYTVQGGSQALPNPNANITAAFVMGNATRLSGVKVTSSGVGIVCDGNSPLISSCTVTGCGATGIRIYQTASPSVTSTTISSNAAGGVMTFDTSAPSFRSCSITGNTGDGVLAQDSSVPNLGDSGTAGANTLTGNTDVGLNNATTASTIQAVGNTWIISTQGSDGSGHYAAALVPGAVAAVAANNYAITNAAAHIQF
jgi:parallel beta-helix repeat protein